MDRRSATLSGYAPWLRPFLPVALQRDAGVASRESNDRATGIGWLNVSLMLKGGSYPILFRF